MSEHKIVIVTAGGTSEPIDAVRKITNTATGLLGSLVADRLALKGYVVYYVAPKDAVEPRYVGEMNRIITNDTNSVKEAVCRLLETENIYAVVHSMAISDYTVKEVKYHGRMLDNKNKISSDYDELDVKLVKTPKIISLIKKAKPDVKLIGFKLLNNVSESDLIAASRRQIDVSGSDYVVANDATWIDGDKHKAIVVNKNGEVIYRSDGTKKDLAKLIVDRLVIDG